MTLPHKPEAVIFDMDGLIFDTEVLYRQAAMATAAKRGHDLPISLYYGTIGLPGDAARDLLRAHFGDDFDFDAYWSATKARFYELAATQLCLKAGVIELLDALDWQGLPRAIATSSSHADVEHHLCAHGLVDRFHAIIARGDYPRGKPHPDPFLLAAERLGVAPGACLALEDSHNGVRAACAAGMMTIMVPDLLEATEEMRGLCVRIATDLNEVCALFGKPAEQGVITPAGGSG